MMLRAAASLSYLASSMVTTVYLQSCVRHCIFIVTVASRRAIHDTVHDDFTRARTQRLC